MGEGSEIVTNENFPWLLFWICLVSENLLCCLYTIFPLHSVAALDLCDHRSITLISSPSGRKIYSCMGSTGTPYFLSYTGFHCSCPSFKSSIGENGMWCKHLVALQLSLAMDIVPNRSVSEEAVKEMFIEMLLSDWQSIDRSLLQGLSV